MQSFSTSNSSYFKLTIVRNVNTAFLKIYLCQFLDNDNEQQMKITRFYIAVAALILDY